MIAEDYEPIIKKIRSWIYYDENKPHSPYNTNRQEYDEFRRKNDLDCILTNGDLNADTIFSLWLPFRLTLVKINGYPKLNHLLNIKNKKPLNKISFLKAISNKNDLEKSLKELLPQENETVKKLIKLFDLGQQRCNVMILKKRSMQSRGNKPYYDYMPYFLYECFDNGAFSQYFDGYVDFVEWVNQEKLNMFFDKEITKDNILDLSGSGDIKNNIPKDIDFLLENYIRILEKRKTSFH